MEVKQKEAIDINVLKAQAFDLIRLIGKKQQEMQQLQQQVSQLEQQILEAEKEK